MALKFNGVILDLHHSEAQLFTIDCDKFISKKS